MTNPFMILEIPWRPYIRYSSFLGLLWNRLNRSMVLKSAFDKAYISGGTNLEISTEIWEDLAA